MAVDDRFVPRFLQIFGLTITLGLAVLVVWFLRKPILFLFAGILLAIFLRGFAAWISRVVRLPMNLSLYLVMIFIMGMGFLLVWFLGPNIAHQTDKLVSTIPGAVSKIQKWAENLPLGHSFMGGESGAGKVLSQAAGLVSITIDVIVGVVLVVFVGIYLAFDPDMYLNGGIRLVPIYYRARVREVLQEVAYTLRWWFVGRLLDMLIVGVLSCLGLWLLKVPLALSLGVMAALLTFVPVFGPVAASIPAILFALTTSLSLAVYVVVLYLVVGFIEGYLAAPLIQRATISLPPVLMIIAVIVFGLVAGVLGAILATPLMAALMVLIKRFYVEDVLGDRVELLSQEGDISAVSRSY